MAMDLKTRQHSVPSPAVKNGQHSVPSPTVKVWMEEPRAGLGTGRHRKGLQVPDIRRRACDPCYSRQGRAMLAVHLVIKLMFCTGIPLKILLLLSIIDLSMLMCENPLTPIFTELCTPPTPTKSCPYSFLPPFPTPVPTPVPTNPLTDFYTPPTPTTCCFSDLTKPCPADLTKSSLLPPTPTHANEKPAIS